MERRDEFMVLFLRHQADLRAFIGSLVRDLHSRDDLFQEVSLILWRQFETYDPTRSFGAWARGIAGNKILQHFQKSERTEHSLSAEAVRAIAEACDRIESEPAHDVERLQYCLKLLPEKSRQLLALRYESGLRLETMAERLKSSLHAVHMALSRIRQKLADCMRSRERQAEGGVA